MTGFAAIMKPLRPCVRPSENQGEIIMASVIKRSGSWQAKIKRKGYPVIFKTFVDKADAKSWARKIEYQMDSGSWVDICTTIVKLPSFVAPQ